MPLAPLSLTDWQCSRCIIRYSTGTCWHAAAGGRIVQARPSILSAGSCRTGSRMPPPTRSRLQHGGEATGISTSPSSPADLLVLDVDPRHGGYESLIALEE